MLKLYLFSVKFPFSSKPISVLTLYQYLPSFSSLSTTISGTLLTTTLEYLLFPESAVMCLGVLFNVIAIKFMVDNPKCKYIKIFLALLVAVFCYQGVLNMFPVIAILVYIVKQILDKREYKVKEKEFFVEMIKLAFIVIVVLAICYEEFSEEQLVFKGNTLYMLVY